VLEGAREGNVEVIVQEVAYKSVSLSRQSCGRFLSVAVLLGQSPHGKSEASSQGSDKGFINSLHRLHHDI